MATVRLGLVINRAPDTDRGLREHLDMALAAAALEWPLCLVFIGDGLRQLLAQAEPAQAALPSGLKAWLSLEELTTVRWMALTDELAALDEAGVQWLRRPDAVDREVLRDGLTQCDRVWVT